jgi:SOS-response transcriptional repressor LexA
MISQKPLKTEGELKAFRERFNQLCAEMGGRPELARISGISISLINKMGGRENEPTIKTIRQIARATGVDYDYLMFGRKSEPFTPLQIREQIKEVPGFEPQKIILVSLMEVGGMLQMRSEGKASIYQTVAATEAKPSDFAVRVVGDDMSPMFLPGDLLVVDPAATAINGSFIIAKVGDGTTFAKFFTDGKVITLQYLSGVRPPITAPADQVEIYGVVLTVNRRVG